MESRKKKIWANIIKIIISFLFIGILLYTWFSYDQFLNQEQICRRFASSQELYFSALRAQTVSEASRSCTEAAREAGDLPITPGRFALLRSELTENINKLKSAIQECATAQICVDRNELEQAVQHFQSAVSQTPDFILPHTQLAELLIVAGKNEEAIAELETAIHIGSENVSVYAKLAKLYRLKGNVKRVVDIYDLAIRNTPPSSSLYCLLGSAQAELGNNQDAIKSYKTGLGFDPEAADIWYLLGSCHYVMRDYASAIDCLEKALVRRAGTNEVWQEDLRCLLAGAYNATGQRENSVSCLKKSISLLPQSMRLRLQLSQLLNETGQYRDAIEQYTVLTEIQPTNSELWFIKGEIQCKIGEYSDAEISYRHGLSLSHASPDRKLQMASILTIEKKFIEAEMMFEALFVDFKKSDEYYYRYGTCLLLQGKYEAAEKKYSEASIINPNRADAVCGLAMSFQALDKDEEADALYRRAIHLDAERADTWYHWGTLAARVGHLKAARARILRAIDLDPENLVYQGGLKAIEGY